MLTATITCWIRSSAAIVAWRRDCSVSPARASTSSSARSAVEAPVTMLRVYCAWPGQSARMNRRRGVAKRAVGDVDRDALLALGAQAVGEQREVEPVDAALLDVRELVGQHGLGVVQQPADQRRLAVVDAAGGGEAQQVH